MSNAAHTMENPLDHLARHLTQSELFRVRSELLSQRLGHKPTAPHPMTMEAEKVRGVSLRDIVNMGLPAEKQRGFSSSDFSALLAAARLDTIPRTFPAPRHRAFCHMQHVPDFRDFTLATGADGLDLEEIFENGEGRQQAAPLIDMGLNTATGAVRTYHRRVAIGRRLALGPMTSGWLQTIPAAMTAAAYRKEATAVFALLASNPIMDDGQTLFIEGVNQTTGATADLDKLLRLFASQTTASGEYLGIDPAAIVWPASVTGAANAQSSLRQAGLNIPFIIDPRATYAYAFADPAQYPTISVFTLTEDFAPLLESISPEQVKDRRDLAALLGITHDFVPVALSRAGIIRIN